MVKIYSAAVRVYHQKPIENRHETDRHRPTQGTDTSHRPTDKKTTDKRTERTTQGTTQAERIPHKDKHTATGRALLACGFVVASFRRLKYVSR